MWGDNMKFENMKIKNIDCAVRFKAKSDGWVAANRKFHIIGVELSGLSLHDFGEKTYPLKKNTLFFFNQKDDYVVTAKERGESLSVHFTTYENIETDTFCIQDGATPEIISLLERLIKESATLNGNDLKLTELFYRLCGKTESVRKKAYSKKDSRMLTAKEYLDSHYTNENCIEIAAENSGVTRRRFNDLFKNSFSITPNRYVIKLKIEYAKQLLISTDLSISKISELCGFSDIYYFSKTFKSETDQTPTDFRKQRMEH